MTDDCYPTAWEFQTIAIAGDPVTGMNGIGKDGWEPIAPMGKGPDLPGLQPGLMLVSTIWLCKRPKRLVEIATQLPAARPNMVKS